MQAFFQFLADNPYILLFFTVGMAVVVGKFAVKGYGLGMVAAAIVAAELTIVGNFLLLGTDRDEYARDAVLDGTPAAIRLLHPIATAVGDQVEVLMDGGVRRGSDVVKALALGARAVLIGRAYLWGLAANGQAGVENVLDILTGGIDSALRGLGKASVHDLTAEDILVPDGFVRALGVPGGGTH